MNELNKQRGIKAENHLISLLNKKGVPYNYEDNWYDIEVNNHLVEIKSCDVACKNGGGNYSSGRFDFTDEYNRELQNKYDIWVCFIVQAQEQFIVLGFCRAKKLKEKRYIRVTSYKKLNLLTFDEWLREVI